MRQVAVTRHRTAGCPVPIPIHSLRAWLPRLLTAACVLPLLGAVVAAAAVVTRAYYDGVRQCFLEVGLAGSPQVHSDRVMRTLAHVMTPTTAASMLAIAISVVELIAQLAFITALLQIWEIWSERQAKVASAAASGLPRLWADKKLAAVAAIATGVLAAAALFIHSRILQSPAFGRRLANAELGPDQGWLRIVHTWADQMVARELVFGPWISAATSCGLALILQLAARVAHKAWARQQVSSEETKSQ